MRKTISLLSAAIFAATLLIGGSTAATADAPTDPFVAKVLQATNQYRAAHGAPPVLYNATISTGSQAWAHEVYYRINTDRLNMATIHRADAGLSILPRGADMYSEVIAINNTAQQVVDWWMGSPSHRAALLNKRATDMGIGQVRTTKAGYYSMTVAVANFAGYQASRNLLANAPQGLATALPFSYAGHVQNAGWQPMVGTNAMAGTVGRGMRLEALRFAGAGLTARAHVQEEGWKPWTRDGAADIGTAGKSQRMEAIQLQSTVPGVKLTYRVHVQNIGWMQWVSDGEIAGTTGKSLRIEAVEIRAVRAS